MAKVGIFGLVKLEAEVFKQDPEVSRGTTVEIVLVGRAETGRMTPDVTKSAIQIKMELFILLPVNFSRVNEAEPKSAAPSIMNGASMTFVILGDAFPSSRSQR